MSLTEKVKSMQLLGCILLLLSASAAAASVHHADLAKHNLLRREAFSVQDGHHAEEVLTEVRNGEANVSIFVDSFGINFTIDNASVFVNGKLTQDVCNDDFPLGKNNSNDCTDPPRDRIILAEGMCIAAAALAGAGIEHNFFVVDQGYQDLHPQGCFAWHCGQSQARVGDNYSTCYYYNPSGPKPDSPKGHPVCFRPEFLNGTEDTNGGCEQDWENILDENRCRIAAECLGFASEPVFDIGTWNYSKHDEYPKGCFIRTDTGAFQFNDITTLGHDPKNPHIGHGIPVCQVKNKVHWG